MPEWAVWIVAIPAGFLALKMAPDLARDMPPTERTFFRQTDVVHEAGIAYQVIEACSQALVAHGGTRATTVGVRIGALAAVDPEALTFCFDALKRDTPLASAALRIEWRSRFGCECRGDTTRMDWRTDGCCPICGAAESLADACAMDISHLEFETGDAS
jgi:hydrogenase nickel incorporation protein HypA/HybF